MIIELYPPHNIHVIVIKLCPSEQNLVTNILKSIDSPYLTPNHAQRSKYLYLKMLTFFRPQFINKNKDHAISCDLMLISTWNSHKLVSLKKGLIILEQHEQQWLSWNKLCKASLFTLTSTNRKQIFSGNVIWLQFINQPQQSSEN